MHSFIAPVVTFRSANEGTPNTPQYALGLAGTRAEIDTSPAPAEIIRHYLLFGADPRLSHVWEDFAAGRKPFWRGP